MEVPEGGVGVVTVADERDHGHIKQFAEFAQGRWQYGRGSAEGIPGLRVHHRDVPVADNLGELPHQDGVVCEFALADAAHGPEKPLPADESVNSHHVVGAVGVNNLSGNLEVHKGVVVAQQQVRRLQGNVHPVEMDCGPMGNHIRPAEEFGYGFEIPLGPDGVTGHVKALERLFHAS